MLLAVLPATAPRKPRCRSMLLRWRTARLRVIDQRHCRVQRSTANVICMQIPICARSPSEPEHQPPTRHWHYPHSARTLSSGFVQSGFYEVALMPALLASPYHATSQNPQIQQLGLSMILKFSNQPCGPPITPLRIAFLSEYNSRDEGSNVSANRAAETGRKGRATTP